MLTHWDERRDITIPGDTEATLDFAASHWIALARHAIAKKGRFAVALSGGSTPKAIFEKLKTMRDAVDWRAVHLYWSDERAVSADHPDSNYKMAMDAAFSHLPIGQIHRMKGESLIEKYALEYEELIKKELGATLFDLVMLGVGEDGHTASLFPGSAGLDENKRLVIANHIPQKNSWRMTLTFRCINESAQAVVYALGPSKQEIVPLVLKSALPSSYPASYVGTAEQKALWILDSQASLNL